MISPFTGQVNTNGADAPALGDGAAGVGVGAGVDAGVAVGLGVGAGVEDTAAALPSPPGRG